MAPLLQKLTTEPISVPKNVTDDLTEREINFALGQSEDIRKFLQFGSLTPFTCPECQGVLMALGNGGRERFRCHTGHAFSPESLLVAISEKIEVSLWDSIRTIEESVMFLNHMGDHYAEVNHPKLAALFFKKAKEAQRRIEGVRKALFNHRRLTMEDLRKEAEEIHTPILPLR
jgi:two-component system chemotaxis response regulator CheB